jgi:hypothetical protein
MIVTEAGVHPNVSALVFVAARAPDARTTQHRRLDLDRATHPFLLHSQRSRRLISMASV